MVAVCSMSARPACMSCCPSATRSMRLSCLAGGSLFPPRPRLQQASRFRHRLQPRAAVEKPDWVRELEEHAQYDESVQRLLEGTGGDPDLIQEKMRREQDLLYSKIMSQRGSGEDAPMKVSFRVVDPFDLWIWVQLYRPPTTSEMEMLQEVINSWFMLGRLGGYNSSNLQVLYNATGDLTDMDYEVEGAETLPASMHDMSVLEVQDGWARFWVDIGTADELALDVLINTLSNFSKEQVGIRHLIIGGANDDWPVPEREAPQATMDPMRVWGPGADWDD